MFLWCAFGQVEFHQHFGDIHRDGRYPGGVGGKICVAEHMAVVFDRGAAARGVDHDGVEARVHFGHPSTDIFGRGCVALVLFAHVVGQCAAAALAFGDHDLSAQSGQQADRRVVDIGVEGALGAACHQGNAHFLVGDMESLGVVVARYGWDNLWGHFQHGAQPWIGNEPCKGASDFGAEQRDPKACRIGQDTGENPAQGAVRQGPFVVVFDIGTGVIDQVHVVNARRAGGHAGKARQAAVDVFDGFGVWRALVLQHVLDQVDAATGAIKLIAKDLIGRAGRGAKPAMHAGAQDFVGPFGGGIGQLLWRESGLHQDMIPVLRMLRGSNLARRPAVIAAIGAGSGWKVGPQPVPRISVAWPAVPPMAVRRSWPVGC